MRAEILLEDVVRDVNKYPLLVPGKALWRLLGFENYPSFSRAARRGVLPFDLTKFPGRRGLFARRADVDRWLSAVLRQGQATLEPKLQSPTNQEGGLLRPSR